MRSSLFRIAALVVLSLGAVTCSEPATPAGTRGAAQLALVPHLTPAAALVGPQLAVFGITVDNVHVVLTRAPDLVVKDTVISFPPGVNAITISLTVNLIAPEETLGALVELRQGTSAYFAGQQNVVAQRGTTTPAGEPVALAYVGPGKDATLLSLTPNPATVGTTSTLQFAAEAFTPTGTQVPDLPIIFESSDSSVVSVTASGLAQALGRTGVVTITALGLNGISATALLTVIALPTATQLIWVTQPVSQALAGVVLAIQPALQLADASGNPVALPGIVVSASVAPSGLALSGTTTATTDARGIATFTNLAISGLVQTATLSFTAPGLGGLSAGVALAAGPAAALAMLAQPAATVQAGKLFSQAAAVQVTDAYGNAVARGGITVDVLPPCSQPCTLGGTTQVQTDGSGIARFSDLTLLAPVGRYAFTFVDQSQLLRQVSSQLVTVTPGDPVSILKTSAFADSQTVLLGATLQGQPQVRVVDAAGNGVPNVTIVWAPVGQDAGALGASLNNTANATTVTDASGFTTPGTWTLPLTSLVLTFQITASGNRADGTPLQGVPIIFTALGLIG